MKNQNIPPEPTVEVDIPDEIFLRCYRHLVITNEGRLESKVDELVAEPDIELLWGGRDSGKSRHIAMQLLIDCMRLPYFRCVLVRKVFNTIHDSQWQLLKDIATEWGVDHLFTFKEHPLEIQCINGNKFICRGMDDPNKLKSVSNPSHCWCEEGNQLDSDDFIIIMTSLRYNSGRVKVWFSFNPECDGDFKEFWLYKTFFEKEKNIYRLFVGEWTHKIPAIGIGKHGKDRIIRFRYRCTWTTYRHNKYVRPERIVFLENAARLDKYYQTVFTNGKWGNRDVKSPFCYCFDEKLHVSETTINVNPYLEVYVSFDFNVDPITCGIYQHSGDEIWCIESIKLNDSNIYELCERVKVSYSNYHIFITGDATGRKRDALAKDNLNYYKVIKTQLGLMDTQIKTPGSNPRVSENRVLVNACFKKIKIHMDPEKCKDLIFDCKNVSVNDVGDIDKGDRNNPVKRADHLDHFRYYLNTFHKHVLKMN